MCEQPQSPNRTDERNNFAALPEAQRFPPGIRQTHQTMDKIAWPLSGIVTPRGSRFSSAENKKPLGFNPEALKCGYELEKDRLLFQGCSFVSILLLEPFHAPGCID